MANQVFRSLCKKNHPFSNFFWGNAKSLNIKNESLRQKLIDAWNKYYGADNMTLVFQARLPLDEMEKWIVEIFSSVSK